MNKGVPATLRLICTRSLLALDVQSLELQEAKEALFRNGDCFVLYVSDGAPPASHNERLISLSSREALLWLNDSQADAEPSGSSNG